MPGDLTQLVGRTARYHEGAAAEDGERADEVEQIQNNGADAVDDRELLLHSERDASVVQ